jgi:hypothetical protein
MVPNRKTRPWVALTDREKLRRLERHHEGTRSRVKQCELELLEMEQRLRMLFRELGLQERRLRPFVRDLDDEEVAQLDLDPTEPVHEAG